MTELAAELRRRQTEARQWQQIVGLWPWDEFDGAEPCEEWPNDAD